MAIAEVGSGSQRASKVTASSPDTLAFPGAVTSGNLLIVAGIVVTDSTTPTVSDSRSTLYTVLGNTTSVAYGTQLFIAYGIASSSGANTVTVTRAGGSQYMSFAIDEFSGVDTNTPLDVSLLGAVVAASLTPSRNITTTADNALIIGVMADATTASTYTVGSGYTQIAEEEDGNTWYPFSVEFKIAGAAGVNAVDWTVSTSELSGIAAASFKPAAGGSSFTAWITA